MNHNILLQWGYYTAVRKNKPLLHAIAWLRHTNIMLSKTARHNRRHILSSIYVKLKTSKTNIWNEKSGWCYVRKEGGSNNWERHRTSAVLVMSYFLTWWQMHRCAHHVVILCSIYLHVLLPVHVKLKSCFLKVYIRMFGWYKWRPKQVESTLESPLTCKKIKLLNLDGKQPWIFIERTDAEAEAPILWPLDVKSQLAGKDADARKD